MASSPCCPSSGAAAAAAIAGGPRGRAAGPAGADGAADCAAIAVASGSRRRLLREVTAAVAPTPAVHYLAPASMGTATAQKSPSAVPRRVPRFPAATAAGSAAAEAAAWLPGSAGKPAKALLSHGQLWWLPSSSMHWQENGMQRGKRGWRGTRTSCSGSNNSSGKTSSNNSSGSWTTTCTAAYGSSGGMSGGATTPAAAAAAAAAAAPASPTAAASPRAVATASLTQLSAGASDGGDALHQTTIARVVSVSGIGLHSGLHTEVTLRPTAAGQGRYFLLPSPAAAGVIVSAAGTGTELEASGEAGDCNHASAWVRVDANIANAVESRLCTVLRGVLPSEGQVLRGGVGSRLWGGVSAEGNGVTAGGAAGAKAEAPAGAVAAASKAAEAAAAAKPSEAADGQRAVVTTVEVRTVEHLLSALEGVGVDNVAIVVQPLEDNDGHALELPLLDGSSLPWVSLLLDEAGLAAAAAEPEAAAAAAASAAPEASRGQTQHGASALQQPSMRKRVVFVGQPDLDHHMERQGSTALLQHRSSRPKALVEGQELELVRRGDWRGVAELAPLVVRGEADGSGSYVAAFPHPWPMLTCAIDFSQLPAVGKQWVSWSPVPCPADELSSHVLTLRCGTAGYTSDVAPARTFAILEQVEQLQRAGLIKGGSLDNALVCSMKTGWVNPPLRFADEPCRHKLLDLIGDLSLLAEKGEPALPCAHIVAYKASHALHLRFAVKLREWLKAQLT